MSIKRAVGIDLGTTYSVASWIDHTGRTDLIRNSEGDLLTPSVVTFADDGIYVGKEAKKLGVLQADRLAECVKRDMGSPFYSPAIDGEYLPPEVIQAHILKKLCDDIVTRVGPDFGVVITVPAFFDEPRRRATAIAGQIAGLHVLNIVNEPIAAALAFGEQMGILDPAGLKTEPQSVLVYDLGGGTFDATLVEISPKGFNTRATDGDVRLGGRDWDRRLVDRVCEQVKRKFRDDPRDNPISLQRLFAEVENAKHSLSARQRAHVHIDHRGISTDIDVSRGDFEECTSDLLERTAHTTRQVLSCSGLEWQDVSRILLAGGSTRMPMVRRMLEQESAIQPETLVSPDEAVARGAAIYAQYLLDQASDSPPTFKITHVSSHNLGIMGVVHETEEKVNAVLIPRNTPLPKKTTRTFVTKEANQRSIAVLVLEGESSLPRECTLIGRATIKELPRRLPAGHPVKITFQYATNGRLHVIAEVPGTDRGVQIDIERGARLPDDGIDEWRRLVTGGKPWSAYKKLLYEQRKRERDAWRQLAAPLTGGDGAREAGVQVDYDQVVLPSDGTPTQGLTHLKDEPVELDRTVETVGPQDTSDSDPIDDLYGSMKNVYAPRPYLGGAQTQSRRPRVFWELLKIISGGMLGLSAGQLILWHGFDRDPFEIGPSIARIAPEIVPEKFRDSDQEDRLEGTRGPTDIKGQ